MIILSLNARATTNNDAANPALIPFVPYENVEKATKQTKKEINVFASKSFLHAINKQEK